MSHPCPLDNCFHKAESMELLTDHLSDDHDIFKALITGRLEVREKHPSETVAATDGGRSA